jgi:hypothetical protein
MCLLKDHAMKMYRGMEVYLYMYLTSTFDGGNWSALHLNYFPARGGSPGTHWIRGWMGNSAKPDTVANKKNLCPCQYSNLSLPAHSLVTMLHYADSATPVPGI